MSGRGPELSRSLFVHFSQQGSRSSPGVDQAANSEIRNASQEQIISCGADRFEKCCKHESRTYSSGEAAGQSREWEERPYGEGYFGHKDRWHICRKWLGNELQVSEASGWNEGDDTWRQFQEFEHTARCETLGGDLSPQGASCPVSCQPVERFCEPTPFLARGQSRVR